MTFEQWLLNVDKILMLRASKRHDDLPDRPWREAFDAGYYPLRAIELFFNNLLAI